MTLSAAAASDEVQSSDPPKTKTRKVIVMARHGERRDYVDKASGKNWIPTTSRPWDPPLSENGVEQSRRMGRSICQTLKELGLPPVSAIYSSPFHRCRQTAVAAMESLAVDAQADFSFSVRVEEGLAEGANASWYASWCLPGADSTYGYQLKKSDGSLVDLHEIDTATIHDAAKMPVQGILDWKTLVAEKDDDSSRKAMDLSHESSSNLPAPYCWGNFETRNEQKERMYHTIDLLAKGGESIICVSHGGPVTHLYERLTGNDWRIHGQSSFTCFSIYVQNDGGQWQPLVVNDSKHLNMK
jgi:broad specificity phosphatase PhoE